MTAVLGMQCSPKAVFLAIAEDGEILDLGPQRVLVPDGLKDTSSVLTLAAELRRRLAEVDVVRGALLAPQSYDGGPKAVASRAGAEAILRLTAAERGVDVEILNRSTARARLGISAAGKLEEHLVTLFPHPSGKYWNDGRKYAAFAALASEKRR